jgi:hypothetical protein
VVIAHGYAVRPTVILHRNYNGCQTSLLFIWCYSISLLTNFKQHAQACVRRLHGHPIAWGEFSNEDEMQQFSQLVNICEPTVTDVIGFMDSVSFIYKCTSEKIQQSAFYCGYDCDTMVNNVFAYGPDCKVFLYAINFPGSWGDGKLTSWFLPHILKRNGSYKICVGQGFL